MAYLVGDKDRFFNQGGLITESIFFPSHVLPLSKQPTRQELQIKAHASHSRH